MGNSPLIDEFKTKGREFAKLIESLPEEERTKGNEAELKRAKEEHEQFQECYLRGVCYLCRKPLKSISKKQPCIHWLLKPKGFKKKDFKSVYDNFGFFQIQSFLRWVANQEAPLKNINNLSEEGTSNKLYELTIKYKNLEWSFSCTESDYRGHGKYQHSLRPHYHFQMRIDKKPFIRFNEFHVPFSEMDIINIEAMQSLPGIVKPRFYFGEGMSEVLEEEVIEQVLNTAASEGNLDEAPLSIDSFAYAEEGKTIKGEDLYALIQEAKEKGVTVASLFHKLPNAETKVIVRPGPGVVEQAPRPGRKKRT